MDQNELVEAAQDVVSELLDCGHEDITVMDLLDVLASTGYTLAKDTSNASSNAYIAQLTN